MLSFVFGLGNFVLISYFNLSFKFILFFYFVCIVIGWIISKSALYLNMFRIIIKINIKYNI